MSVRASGDRTVRRTEGHIVREEARVDLHPADFLRWGAGLARGFWARDAGWIAHVGDIASLEHPGDAGGVGVPDEARFEAVEALARKLLPEVSHARGAPRLYGGFSFRADHVPSGVWKDFPAARFVLPELELERTVDGEVWLRAQERVFGEGGAGVRARLRERLEEVRKGVEERASSAVARGVEGADGARLAGVPGNGDAAAGAERWERAVLRALEAIRGGGVEKVVLARTLDVRPDSPLDPVDVVMRLWRDNRRAHVFLFEPVPGAVLTGAAPETIATLFEGVFRATAVAGSVSSGESPAERARLARFLLESGKDRVEHACTVEEIVRRLTPHAEEVSIDSEPHVLALSRIQHLETKVRARAREGETVLTLLAALHPTPAVCGLPRGEALDFLRAEEPFDRGWYAGPVGWFDGAGEGVFVPSLRCAVAAGGTWRLVAGAGIVPGSDPALEWEETEIKFQPILRALAGSENPDAAR
jgi:menaquinone-specific isochorismate synthase